ncbi:MAG: hypothetical protein ACLTZB_02520 [Streptococcus salivarius]
MLVLTEFLPFYIAKTTNVSDLQDALKATTLSMTKKAIKLVLCQGKDLCGAGYY